MRTLCASTLIGEAFVIGLAGLVAMNLSGYASGTVWAVCGSAMALCVLLCGLVTRPGGVAVGWVLQAALVASGLVIPMMFFLGASFAGLWWAAVHFGRRIDEFKRRAEQPAATTA
ncbi:DUF4233 domain-containing protein [Streptomyces sp. ICBB 8177]|uniref:DUF4233 domain-containing protein n=1 Tax=Streptomyces sp. ICBB 8177 TaxID=563922 RepID=UPI000D679E9C|nr:DUF4233 domain-containing protein [Streptomyces sp. ICBB 8177]PWI45487.1 hypothetical protein CK485_05065 [Streptomyces sp. ICBB 8177]